MLFFSAEPSVFLPKRAIFGARFMQMAGNEHIKAGEKGPKRQKSRKL